jgi:hypothetical protein
MKIKGITIASSIDDRLETIFKQLGAKYMNHNGQSVLVLNTTPDVMAQKVEIAYEQLRKLGYDNKSQSQKHFWYIVDAQNELPEVQIESQGSEGFIKEKHNYTITW